MDLMSAPKKNLMPWLETLRIMAENLGPQRSFQANLSLFLSLLSERHGFMRSHLVLFEPETGLLRLSLADSSQQAHEASYTPGVGVTGQVFATGKSVIVEKMKGHPQFMSRLFTRTDEELESLSFICVPVLAPISENVMTAREVIGTLNADTQGGDIDELAWRCLFLEVVASLVATEAAHLQEEMLRQRRFTIGRSDFVESADTPFIAHSKVMRHIVEQSAHLAQGRAPILLRGEAGVGKERLVRRIHATSPRRDMPLIVCHCGTLSSDRMEAELVGYQKSAFPGAVQTHKGLFEQAHQGTLYLDAIENLPASAQEALLRLLQDYEVLRLGAAKPIHSDVRLIAATSASLDSLVESGKFSMELYARLNVCSLNIPPLRERREDIIPLAEYMLKEIAENGNSTVKRISYPALELLTRYYWPGNVPEIKSCLERAAQYCEDHVIRAGDLPPSLQTAESTATEAGLSLGDAVTRFEKEMLVDALIKAGGNMLKAARDLKTSYRIVNYKVKKYGIDPHQFTVRKM